MKRKWIRFTMKAASRRWECRAYWSDEDDAYLVQCLAAKGHGWMCHGRSLKAAKRHARIVLGMMEF